MDLSSFNVTLRDTIGGRAVAATCPSSPQLSTEQQDQQTKSKHSERIALVKNRFLSYARTLRQGATQLPPNSPSRQLHPNYQLREIVCGNLPFSYSTTALLRTLWRQSDTPSFLDFIQKKRIEFQGYTESCTSPLTFELWLALELMRKTEYDIWEKCCNKNSTKSISFEEWKQEQQRTVPEFGMPLWGLIEEYEADKTSRQKKSKPSLSFEDWLPTFKEKCQTHAMTLKESFGLEMSVQNFASEYFCHPFTHSTLNLFYRILNEERKSSGSQESLEHYIVHLYHAAKGINAGELEKLWQEKDASLQNRHRGTNSSLSFEEWRKTQVDDVFNSSPRLTRCSPAQRIHFLTTVEGGILRRNAHPLNTAFERVDNHERCIFVIGPDQSLYCASKVRKVFQHSSFTAGGLVCSAGILKTDEQGRLKNLSNSSGHYRSDQKSDLFMLEYFRQRGVDLSTVQFSIFGKNETLTAEEYYNQLSQSSN